MTRIVLLVSLPILVAACGGAANQRQAKVAPGVAQAPRQKTPSAQKRQMPPAPSKPTDVNFPAIGRSQLANKLELNLVELNDLPVVNIRLVIRNGSASDPEGMPGIADLTASMLKEGTRKRSSAELAEAIEFLGADLHVGSDDDYIYLSMQTLRQHLPEALELLAEVASQPAFRKSELAKLVRREQARLELQSKDPYYLASKAFHHRLYQDHPYATIDTTPEVLNKVTPRDLQQWHSTYARPNNAFLVAVGDLQAAEFKQLAAKAFAGWKQRALVKKALPQPQETKQRHIYIVDRPDSVQSVIYVGNIALERDNKDYIDLLVANQVLGGSAASRLFMDLREQRSLTYGAYSRVGSSQQDAPFRAMAAVRTEVTAQAMAAFLEHLERIRKEAPPADELASAQRYLSDSFPLRIETSGSIAQMIAEQRIYGLPDNYWDHYRSQIRKVTPQQALQAAKDYIKPQRSVIVVVGKASAIAESLRKYGAVTVMDTEGKVISSFKPAGTSQDPS